MVLSTSLAAATVAGWVLTGSVTPIGPTWQDSYRLAIAQATELQKPVAVFIGNGPTGATRLVREKELGSDAIDLLRKSYVCLYVDTATPAGKELASSFGMDRGLVISDRTGGVQALRHEGDLANSNLTEYLRRYKNVSQVASTEFAGLAKAPTAPAVQPVTGFSPAMMYPGTGFGGFQPMNFGGG